MQGWALLLVVAAVAGGGCGGCDGAQMVLVSLGESHKQGHRKSSIEAAKRVVQKSQWAWSKRSFIYGSYINTVSSLRSSVGAVRVGRPYGTSEGDSSCTTTTQLL